LRGSEINHINKTREQETKIIHLFTIDKKIVDVNVKNVRSCSITAVVVVVIVVVERATEDDNGNISKKEEDGFHMKSTGCKGGDPLRQQRKSVTSFMIEPLQLLLL
jgi:hypothetical protein